MTISEEKESPQKR